ncbi:MAG: NAD(P)-binding protein [Candidatus Thorarchaeota archaeon]
MVILDNAVLKNKYQIIVIGAGLGGLTAASLLAKRGLDVLVIEQHYQPGGSCTSFKKEDRIFDCGTATIFGFGEKGFNPFYYVLNQLEEQIKVIPRSIFHRMWFLDDEILFWKDINSFLDEVVRIFPNQENEIRDLYDYLFDFYNKYIKNRDMLTPPSEFSWSQKMKMLFKDPIGTSKIGLLLFKSAKDIMKPYIKDQKLIEFYDMLCSGYSYTLVEETPALMALTMFTDNHEGGPFYIAGGAQILSNILEKGIEKYGGSLLYRHLVEKIIMNDHHEAIGVRLEDGTEIFADKVISDACVWDLYRKLIGPSHLKEKQIRWVDNLRVTYPAMVLYAAVPKNIFPEKLYPVEYFITDSTKIDAGDIMLYIPTLEDDSLGPPDEHIITIFSPAPNQEWPHPFEKEYQSPQYIKRKKRRAEYILDEIDKKLPGFKDAIRILYIATPSTIERFTLKYGGCVGGPVQSIGQELLKRLHAKTDWKNLYACGDSTTMGMGAPAVCASGIGVANVILRELGLKRFAPVLFEKDFIKKIQHNNATKDIEFLDEKSDNAQILARKCQHCEDRPCQICPAGIDIPLFMRRIEVGNFSGAVNSIHHMNPLPIISGYLCPAEKYCQKVCYRNNFSNKPVQIRELHKWVAKHTIEDQIKLALNSPNGRNVAVVGAGINGLVVSYFLANLGYNVSLFEKDSKIGGTLYQKMKSEIPGDLVERELSSLLIPNIYVNFETTLGKDIFLDDLKKDYDAVYIAHQNSNYLAKEQMKIEGYTNVFTSYPLLSNDKKADFSPIIGISRNAVQIIDDFIKS